MTEDAHKTLDLLRALQGSTCARHVNERVSANDQQGGGCMSGSRFGQRVACVALGVVIVTALVPMTALGSSDDAPVKAAEAIPYPNNSDDNVDGAVLLDGVDQAGTQQFDDWLSDLNGSDTRDVYAVWLLAGESVTATLTDVSDIGWGIRAFDPWTQDVTVDVPLASSADVRDPSVTFTADDTGYYYLEVYTSWLPYGYYSLTTTVNRADTDVQISSAGRTLPLWGCPTITGAVVDRFGRVPMGTLLFSFSFDGLDWLPLGRQSYQGGQFSFRGFEQWRNTYYMVTFEGTGAHTTNSQTSQVFATKSIVSNPTAPSTMYKGKYKTVYGYLEPKHTAGSYPVRIYKYKKVSGKWKSYGYVNAKASTVNDSKSKYARSLCLPSTGSWRLRAYAPADSRHAATWSTGYDYVTVK